MAQKYEYREGEWVAASDDRDDPPPAAVQIIAGGWQWFCLDGIGPERWGTVPTREEAQAAALAALRAWEEGRL